MKHLSQTYFFYLLSIIFLLLSCTGSNRLEKDSIIEKIFTEISTDEIEKTISDLVAFETRFPYQKQIEVADYLYDRLNVYIANLNFHEYHLQGVKWKNVIGTIPGKINPDKYVIVSAHFDTKSENRLSYAPGADDNASGCAAVMELVRVLSQLSFEKSIRFIFFSREEMGFEGSAAYLKSIDRNKETIVAAINLDMIAYGGKAEDIDLVTRPKYAWLAKNIHDLADLYGLNTKKVIDKHCF